MSGNESDDRRARSKAIVQVSLRVHDLGMTCRSLTRDPFDVRANSQLADVNRTAEGIWCLPFVPAGCFSFFCRQTIWWGGGRMSSSGASENSDNNDHVESDADRRSGDGSDDDRRSDDVSEYDDEEDENTRQLRQGQTELKCTGSLATLPDAAVVFGASSPPIVLRVDTATTVLSVDELLPLTAPAKFGHGTQTVLDERTRRCPLKVGADVVSVEWAALDKTLATIHRALRGGVCSRLTAHLHDVLLYRPGDFFVKHTDSLKSPRHLLTMSVVVALSGCGEATGDVQFPTLSTTWQGRVGGDWCAWYTSEEHAVTPLTGDGHRVVATYIVEEHPMESDGEERCDAVCHGAHRMFTEPLLSTTALRKGANGTTNGHGDGGSSLCALPPVVAADLIRGFLSVTDIVHFLVARRGWPFDGRLVRRIAVDECVELTRKKTSPPFHGDAPRGGEGQQEVDSNGGRDDHFLFFLKYDYSAVAAAFPDRSIPFWHLRGSDMEMFQVLEAGFAAREGDVTIRVGDVDVIHEWEVIAHSGAQTWRPHVGPLPRKYWFFPNIKGDHSGGGDSRDPLTTATGSLLVDGYFHQYRDVNGRHSRNPLDSTPSTSFTYHHFTGVDGPADVLDKGLDHVHSSRRIRLDEPSTTTVIYRQGWPVRHVTHNSDLYEKGESVFTIDRYRRTALMVTVMPARRSVDPVVTAASSTAVARTNSGNSLRKRRR